MADPLATYLQELSLIKSSGAGVEETSGYTALSNLLNEVGKTLKPRVRCIINLRNKGAGLPDGGLFSPDQFQRASEAEPLPGQLPSRGAIEVKGTRQAIHALADGEQVGRYLARYGQVLVTNYRDFILVGKDPDGARAKLEEYRLAPGEAAFWTAAAHSHKTAEEHGERFVEYLKRVMLHAAPIAAPKDVAWFLASYARDARARIEIKARATGGELPALANVRDALEQALGIKFEGDKGEHFFRSTLVQTLFYGVFSAWVLWAKKHPPTDRNARFNWHEAQWSLHVPMIRALYHQVADPARLGPLGLAEVLDWTGAVLNRVERATFFERFSEDHAVQYFYEPFLQAFDPVLRKELGVWYTPTEVVKYMVARVDAVLRSELGVPDGLADPRVYVLDPCCGTGAYLVEVVRLIHDTLSQGGADALVGDDLKHAAMERVFGFEILPAPFVVAHLQMGLTLQNLGAHLDDARNERVGVYLTNALTGWEPPTGPKQRLIFPELEEERDAADKVKRDTPILVILGNPPYNGYAGVAVDEERDLTDAYRTTKRAPAPQGQGLNDPYVRFFRRAEKKIVEKTGRGIVSFISNYSWLDARSHPGMRERYIDVFNRIWIDNLHGDRIISEVAPDGRASETVFSIRGASPGIQVGTAIVLMAKSNEDSERSILYRDMNESRAVERRAALLKSLECAAFDAQYQSLSPSPELGLPLKPRSHGLSYLSWPLLPELFPVAFPGVKTSRDSLVVDMNQDHLIERMRTYFDGSMDNDEMRRILPSAVKNTKRFNATEERKKLVRRGYLPANVVRYLYRPFDLRWLYWEPDGKLLDEKRSEYYPHVFMGNHWITSVSRIRRESFYQPQVTSAMIDMNVIEANVQVIPLLLKSEDDLFSGHREKKPTPNLSQNALDYLSTTGKKAADLFYHVAAVLHSPSYANENIGALHQDWARISLPLTGVALSKSASLGRIVGALVDPDVPVKGVSVSPVRPELKVLGVVQPKGKTTLDAAAGDLVIDVGWGYMGKNGIMCGQGRLQERVYSSNELAALRTGAEAKGFELAEALQLLGDTTFDVSLNGSAFWQNIPSAVWNFTLGGYPVLRKWLSYRESKILNRALTKEEARELTNITRRIAALILLQPELDASYAAVKANVYDWPRAPQSQA
jgi:hypothetical protein